MSKKETTINTYNQAAKAYQNKFMQMDLYNDCYDLFCKHIDNREAHLLEVACGPGNVTRYLLNNNPNYKILGIDLAPNMVSLAQKNVPNATFRVMDCLEIDQLNSTFDAIMCAFCLPYLSKEQLTEFLLHSAKVLHTGGMLYLSTMEGKYSNSGFETTSFSGENKVYIYYYSREYLRGILEQYGFGIIDFRTKQYPEPDGSFLTDLIYIARKKI